MTGFHSPRQALARLPLLDLLGAEWLDAWIAQGEERTLALGETLCQANVWARWFYLVLDGRVRVVHPKTSEREVALGIFGAGAAFGEYALLSPGVMPVACRAASTVRVLRLKLRKLREAVNARPEIQQSLRAWLRLHALLRFLREESFLGFMSAPSFLPLQERLRSEQHCTGRTIQSDGLNAERWFFIGTGSVRMEGRSGASALLGQGDCFGAGALLGEEGFPIATAAKETQLLSLSRDEFLAPLAGEGPAHRQSLQAPPPIATFHPWIAQREQADCGVAAVTMVARYHGRLLPIEEVRRRVPIGPRGCNLAELCQGAAALGFKVGTVRIGPEQLDDVRLPAVALLTSEHFVVLYACQGAELVIGDPATSVQTWSRDAFAKCWTGNLLLLAPPAPSAPGHPSMPSGSWILPPESRNEST